jgi:hypothetical protein
MSVANRAAAANTPHRIRRQRWRVMAPSRPEGCVVRRHLRRAWTETLPAFEAAFDQAVADDVVVYLSRLDLHVAVAATGDLATTLPVLIADQLREQLGVLAQPSTPSSWTRASLEADTLELLWQYLHTGRLLWHRFHDDREALSGELIAAASRDRDRIIGRLMVLATQARDGVSASPSEEQAVFAAVFRWLQLVPESEWTSVARIFADRLFGDSGAGLEEAFAELADAHRSTLTRPERLILAAALLEDRLRRAGRNAFWPRPARRVLEDRAVELGPALAAYIRRRVATTGSSATGPEPSRPSKAAPEPAHADEEFALPVAHAGLVVLHPFISQLFERTAILNMADDRLYEAALPRAAALLHYAATGNDDVFEFDLGLVKVLLGLTPETALAVAPGLLDSADKQEADVMIEGAVAHWQLPETITVAEVRRWFLQRGGLLRRDAQGFALQVPQEPFDLLLRELPWRLRAIQLPWMPRLLLSDWSQR